MKRVDQREYPFDGEFTIDQVDWREIPADKVEAGLADLVTHGFLIKTSRGTYQMSIARNNGNTKEALALFRKIRNLTPAGASVLVVGTTSPEQHRLIMNVMARTSDATTPQRVNLLRHIEAVYDGDVAAAADDLRDGKITIERRPRAG